MLCKDLAALLLQTPDAEVVTYDSDFEAYSPVTGTTFEAAGINADIMVDQVILNTDGE